MLHLEHTSVRIVCVGGDALVLDTDGQVVEVVAAPRAAGENPLQNEPRFWSGSLAFAATAICRPRSWPRVADPRGPRH